MGKFITARLILSFGCVFTAHAQPAAPLTFDVASIKIVTEKGAPSLRVTASGVECTCPLRPLIAAAYSVNQRSISSTDGRSKDLLDSTLYNVVARTDHPVSKDQLMGMLQALVSERFKLTVHRDSKMEPVYNLVAKGPKMKDAASEGTGGCAMGANRTTKCTNTTMAAFSSYLTTRMGRVEVNQTGLDGRYDFELQLEGIPSLDDLRAGMAGGDPAAAKRSMGTAMNDWTTSSIFTDLPKQLGLKLEADKGPVDSIVIEHLEKPSEN